MRHAAALLSAAAVLAAGCGGDSDKPAAAPRATVASSQDPGLRVFVAQGCGTCHTLAAAGSESDLGPDLGSSLKGDSRAEVIESIVAPNASTAAGFEMNAGMMPDDYGTRIRRPDLEQLTDFLIESARG